MAFGPSLRVDAPPRIALPYGLFSVVTLNTPNDVHWQNGINWEPAACKAVHGIGDPSCDPATPTLGLPKLFEDPTCLTVEATPFTVYGEYNNSLLGHPVTYAEEQARATLLRGEEARVEQAIWTGDLDNVGFAADAEILGTGMKPAAAFALLEQWISDTFGALGVIHLSTYAGAFLAKEGCIGLTGNKMLSKLGTPVIIGAGYPGTSPTGEAPGNASSWVYATGQLFGSRSEVFVSSNAQGDLLDRSVNTLFAVAERTYVLDFDRCGDAPFSAAVNFTIPLT